MTARGGPRELGLAGLRMLRMRCIGRWRVRPCALLESRRCEGRKAAFTLATLPAGVIARNSTTTTGDGLAEAFQRGAVPLHIGLFLMHSAKKLRIQR